MATRQLKDILVVDPNLNVAGPQEYAVARGPLAYTLVKQSPSSASNGSFQWNVTPNKGNLITDYWRVNVPFTVNITATGIPAVPAPGGTTLKAQLNNGLFALRQKPLSSVTNVCTIQVNDQTVTFNTSQVIHELSRFNGGPTNQMQESINPTFPDQSANYSDLTVGSIKNPLNNYNTGSTQWSDSRGVFNQDWVDIISTNAQWQFTGVINEAVQHPLLANTAAQANPAFPYLYAITLTMNFYSNLTKMFSLDYDTFTQLFGGAAAITSFTVNFGTPGNTVQPFLFLQQLTMPAELPSPNLFVKGYDQIVVQQSSLGANVAPQASATFVSQQFTLNQIPRQLWVYVKRSVDDVGGSAGANMTDTTFSIQQVSVQFNNKSGLMSTLLPADLYNECVVRMGGFQSYSQFINFQGAVLCIDPTRFFELAPDQAPGVEGMQVQLTVTVNATNLCNYTISPSLWVAYSYESVLSINAFNGSVNNQAGVLTREEVLRSNSDKIKGVLVPMKNIFGGSFFGDLWSGVKNVGNTVGNIANQGIRTIGNVAPDVIRTGLQFAPQLLELAPHLIGGRGGNGNSTGNYYGDGSGNVGGGAVNRRSLLQLTDQGRY